MPRLGFQCIDLRFVESPLTGAKTPGMDQIADTDIEGPVRFPADRHRGIKHREQLFRDGVPFVGGSLV